MCSLSLRSLAECFHLPLDEAARKLDVCVATIKRICRGHNIRRWPYRSLRAVKRRREILERGGHLTPSETAVMHRCEEDILRLRNTVLAEFDSIPAIDEVFLFRHGPRNAAISPRDIGDNSNHLPSDLVEAPLSARSMPIIPVQTSINAFCPAFRVDSALRRTVSFSFLPR